MRNALVALLLFILSVSALAQPAPEPATGRYPKSELQTRQAMVVAAHPLAAEAGWRMIQQGGSAADAAVAIQLMLTLVEPQSSGLGGGAFLLHWDEARQSLRAFDGREAAPMAATPGLFLKADGSPMSFPEAVLSGRSVGVPGAIRMLETVHRLYGRLPWAKLAEPAIQAAEMGFTVTPRLEKMLTIDPALRRNPAAQALYYQGRNEPLKAGTQFRNPNLAQSLRRVATEGADGLLKGELARDIVRAVQNHPVTPGMLNLTDLARYEAKERTPVCAPFRIWRICGFGPPSSGGIAVLQILGLMEASGQPQGGTVTIPEIHRFIEAGRLAFADRDMYVADSDFLPVPVAGLIDRNYIVNRARLIKPAQSMGEAAPGEPPGRRGEVPGLWRHDGPPGTSHLSVVDLEGNAISMTTSIESAFGSRLMVGGFLLNNELTDFSFKPEVNGHAVVNRVEPGKRPRSSMSPSMVFDGNGRLVMVAGSVGGSQIINDVAQALWLILDKGWRPQAAAELYHFGSRNGPAELETGADPAWQAGLEAFGHKVQSLEMTSGLHIVLRTRDGWLSGIDPRREGAAFGR